MARNEDQSNIGRDRYRDNDDVRNPLDGNDRSGTSPDSKSEARGDARENVGNTARGTDTNVTGPAGNDRQRGSPRADEFDDTLDSAG